MIEPPDGETAAK